MSWFKPKPKFAVGQMVTVTKCREAKFIGHVDTVKSVEWVSQGGKPKDYKGFEVCNAGWWYRLDGLSDWYFLECVLQKLPDTYDGNTVTTWKENDVWHPKRVNTHA